MCARRRKRYVFSILTGLFLPIIFFLSEAQAKEECQEIQLGVWQPPAPGDFGPLTEFENQIGQGVDIVSWYHAWGNPQTAKFNPEAVEWVHARGDIPMLTWEPWDTRLNADDPLQELYSMSSVIDGHHDKYIREWARQASEAQGQIYLRFAHEANGYWYPWTPAASGKSPEVYKAAWRHVVRVFREEGADNVLFVWSPNRDYPGATPLLSLYPDDRFVDVIGIDGYNFGDVTGQHFRSFNETFLDTYQVTRKWSVRPVIIGETGTGGIGGDRAQWLLEGLSLQNLKNNYPDLIGVVYFNQRDSGWPLSSDDGSLQTFAEVVREWRCE